MNKTENRGEYMSRKRENKRINNSRQYYNDFSLFRPFTNKIYWLILLGIALIIASFIAVILPYIEQEPVGILMYIRMFSAVVFGVSIVVLLARLIIHTILDLIYSDAKGRLLLIILLILFTLRACAEIVRSTGK